MKKIKNFIHRKEKGRSKIVLAILLCIFLQEFNFENSAKMYPLAQDYFIETNPQIHNTRQILSTRKFSYVINLCNRK